MSGDIGRGATREAIAFAVRLASAKGKPKGFHLECQFVILDAMVCEAPDAYSSSVTIHSHLRFSSISWWHQCSHGRGAEKGGTIPNIHHIWYETIPFYCKLLI